MPGQSFDVYEQAYYDAAEAVYARYWSLSDGKHRTAPHPDWVVWPVLFLLHHFVELELKEIIQLAWSIGRELKVELKPYPDNLHDLRNLMKMAKWNLRKIEPSLEGLDLD